MEGCALQRGDKEGHDRRKILIQSTIYFLFFSDFPDQPTPFWSTFCLLSGSKFFWAGTSLGKRGHCTAVSAVVSKEMSRAPFSVPPPCDQSLTLPNVSKYFSCFALPMQAGQDTVPKSPPPVRFARSRLLFFLVCFPAHVSHSVCLPVSHGPPFVPYFLTPHFFPLPPLTYQHLF
jgi:hypothetical protein